MPLIDSWKQLTRRFNVSKHGYIFEIGDGETPESLLESFLEKVKDDIGGENISIGCEIYSETVNPVYVCFRRNLTVEIILDSCARVLNSTEVFEGTITAVFAVFKHRD